MRWTLVTAGMMAVMVSGCATIKETQRNEDKQVRTYTEHEVGAEGGYDTKATLLNGPDGGPRALGLDVSKYKTCSTIENIVFDRTEHTERELVNETGGSETGFTIGAGVVGGIGAGLLGVGVAGLASGKPFRAAAAADENPSITGSGWMTIGGGLLTSLLVVAVVDGVRGIDGRSSIGLVTERKVTKTEPCQHAPAAGAEIVLVPDDAAVGRLTGKTDENGHVEIDLAGPRSRGEPFGGTYNVVLNGEEVATTEALRPLHLAWIENQRQKQEEAARREEEARRLRVEAAQARLKACRNCPERIKDAAIIEEAGGYNAYFSFVDRNGAYVPAEGKVTIVIGVEQDGFPIIKAPIKSFEVGRSDFQRVTIGLGGFARPALVWSKVLTRDDFASFPGAGWLALKQLAESGQPYMEIQFADDYERVLTGRARFDP